MQQQLLRVFQSVCKGFAWRISEGISKGSFQMSLLNKFLKFFKRTSLEFIMKIPEQFLEECLEEIIGGIAG